MGDQAASGRRTATFATGYHVTALAYEGIRIERSTSTVRTGGDASSLIEEAVTVTREYDRRGRLYRVIEPSGPNGENVTTTHTYDAADRLIQVQIQAPEATQTRTFTYDGRGFLLSETRPELGATGNGTIYFHEYDARGHARRRQGGPVGGKFDVRFSYDSAERLTAVRNAFGGSIKQFVYATTNGPSDWKNGKLVEATRWNQNRFVQRSVRQIHEYRGIGGRVSRRATTIVDLTNGTTERTWDQGFIWNDLGEISRLAYPTQTVPAYHAGRNVDFGYAEGRMTSASGYFSLYYHPNGLVGQVYFAGGPRWAQHNSPHHLPRPAAIFSSLTMQNWDTGQYRYDGSGNVAAIGTSYYLYDKAGRVRYSAEAGTARAYTYDSFGNRAGFPGYPDASTNRLTGSNYAYDEAGNLTKDGASTFGYDWLSALSMLSDSTYGRNFDYVYSADDQRIGSYDASLAAWTWNIRDLSGNVLSEFTSSGWTKDYIYRNGMPAVAVHASGAGSVFMVDHRGTPRQITAWDGSVSVRHDYHAFGEEVTNPAGDTESIKFGAYRRDFCCTSGGIGGDDRGEGLFYSSSLGRLRSVTHGEDPSSPQSWNGYVHQESGVLGSTVLRLRPAPDNDDCRGCPKADMEIDVVGQTPLINGYIPPSVWRLIIANPTRPGGQPRPGGGGGSQPSSPQPQPQPRQGDRQQCIAKAQIKYNWCIGVGTASTAYPFMALESGCLLLRRTPHLAHTCSRAVAAIVLLPLGATFAMCEAEYAKEVAACP